VTQTGHVIVEGETVGQLDGFCFIAESGAESTLDEAMAEAGPVRAAANRVLREAIGPRLRRFSSDEDGAFALSDGGELLWHGQTVARLTKAASVLRPNIEVVVSDLLDRRGQEAVRQRLTAWLDNHIRAAMAPLLALEAAPLSGAAKGLAYQLAEGLGSVATATARDQSKALSRRGRQELARLGVRFGVETIFLPEMLKKTPVALRGILVAVYEQRSPIARDGGLTSIAMTGDWPDTYYLALGYRPAGPIAVRVDMLERLLADVRRGLKGASPYVVPTGRMTAIGASVAVLAEVLRSCGFQTEEGETGVSVTAGRRGNGARKGPRSQKHRRGAVSPDSPFAKLAVLRDGR
ncbi:MAG: hypothetical protein ACTSX7_02345, partial [Alphaproteobacteria bacterium]